MKKIKKIFMISTLLTIAGAITIPSVLSISSCSNNDSANIKNPTEPPKPNDTPTQPDNSQGSGGSTGSNQNPSDQMPPDNSNDGNTNPDIGNGTQNKPTQPPSTDGSSPIQPNPDSGTNKPNLPNNIKINTNLNGIYDFIKKNIIANNISIIENVKNIIYNNKDIVVKSINNNLSSSNLNDIIVTNNAINLVFDTNTYFNSNNITCDNIHIASNEHTIDINGFNFIKQPIIPNNQGINKESFYQQNMKPEWNDQNYGINTPKYSFNEHNDTTYNGSRSKYNNLASYTSEVAKLQGFPGIPTFANNWYDNSSVGCSLLYKWANEHQLDYSQANNYWTIKLLEECRKFLDPNFIINEINNNQLKKYPYIDEMFGNFSVNTNQNAVRKQFSIASNIPRNILLGLYAPAGEVITMSIPRDQLDIIKNLNYSIIIGNEWQEYSSKSNSLKFRLPKMNTEFSLNSLINIYEKNNNFTNNQLNIKFGSPMGGAIYLKTDNNFENYVNYGNVNFSIEGAIEYANFIYGYTTKEEWHRLVTTTNVPIFSLSAENFNLLKPWFIEPNNNSLDLLNKAKVSDPSYRLNFFNNIFKLSHYMVSNDVGFYKDKILEGLLFFCNDYIAAGSACNFHQYIQMPLYELNNLFDSASENNSGAIYDWGTEHEGNHSYESSYHPFNFKEGEMYNNVLNIIENACIADETIWRDEYNYKDEGWGRTNTGFNAINTWYESSSNRWFTSNDRYSAYATFIHAIGSKYSVEWARALSLLHKTNVNNHIKINDVDYNFSALSYALFSIIANVNLWDFLQTTRIIDYEENWLNNPDSEVWNQYMKIYHNYISKLPVYHPIGNLYASGSFIPKNNEHTSWEYGGDTVRAFQVSHLNPTHFDMNAYTKFTNIKNNQLASLKEIKIINKPKFGSIILDNDNKGFTYIPNSDSQINDMDEIIVEIIDSFDDKNRILIRPLIQLKSSFEQNIITYNPNYLFNNRKVQDIINTRNWDNIKNIFLNLPTLINNSNFVINNQKEIITKNYQSSQIFNDQIINNQQIRWTRFTWTAPETGWYRINLNIKHNNYVAFDYGIISELNNNNFNHSIENYQELIANDRWLLNANYEQYGHGFEKETSPVKLVKNKKYIIDFFDVIYDKNTSSCSTVQNMSFNYLGNNETDKQKNSIDINKQLFKNSLQVASNSINESINLLDKYNQYKGIDLKKYYWYVENSILFNEQTDINGVNTNFNRDWRLNELLTKQDIDIIPNTVLNQPLDDVKNLLLNNNSKLTKYSISNNGGFIFNFVNPITVRKIYLTFSSSYYAAQKVIIKDLDANKILYNNFIDKWWEPNASITFLSPTNLKHFSIEFIKAIDERTSIPENIKVINSESFNNNYKIELESKSFVFDSFKYETDKNIYKYMKYGYSIFNKNVNICGPWNITNNNAIFDNKQLISRYVGSEIIITVPKSISKIAIIGDQFTSSANFDVIINNQYFQSFNNYNANPKIASVLCEIPLNSNQSNLVKIKVTKADINNPFSFQGILLN